MCAATVNCHRHFSTHMQRLQFLRCFHKIVRVEWIVEVGSDSGINGKDGDETKPITEEEEEARRIAELGKPRLGTNANIEIVIEESYEFKV